ncbi:MAG: hypothetical protein R3C42_05020 [Parvularculaceae bacterium]
MEKGSFRSTTKGHALSVRMSEEVGFPYLLLLVSGGHTQLIEVSGVGAYRRLGTTIDDAAGEAFDKSAKLLGLRQPGGPQIEAAAEKGDAGRFDFPKPLARREGCDFSLAGLKTALRLAAEAIDNPSGSILPIWPHPSIRTRRASLGSDRAGYGQPLRRRPANASRRYGWSPAKSAGV